MEKMNAVLVVLNDKYFNHVLDTLNFKKVNLIAVIIENAQEKTLSINDEEIPIVLFSKIRTFWDDSKELFWLISGFVDDLNDLYKFKKFLMNNGIPEENIINFEILSRINSEWLGNLRYIEKHGADFFATGDDYTEVGLDLNCIPHARGRGINLASSNQDLRQSYLTAKHVFANVSPGTIKFVLIGLSPYSFHFDSAKDFSACSSDFQYMLALKNFGQESFYNFLLRTLTSDSIKKIFSTITSEQADLNFDYAKSLANPKIYPDIYPEIYPEIHLKSVINWESEIDNLTKKIYPDTVENNFQILKDYIKLCLENGAKPIGFILPFAPIARKNYDEKLLNSFQSMIQQLEESYDFKCVDLFDFKFDYDCFYDMTHLNVNGSKIASLFISLQLYEWQILSIEDFCDLNYDSFKLLAKFMPKDNYNAFIDRVFKLSVQKIRRKDKIKVAFAMIEAAHWCGDDLYNFFANDDRFETTVFLCMDFHKEINELVEKDFWRGVEQLKSHGLNIVPLHDKEATVPAQDVIIFLTPYIHWFCDALQLKNLTPKTLLGNIFYAFDSSIHATSYYNDHLFSVAWKMFFSSVVDFKLFNRESIIGMPRGIYSGYPRMDIFFKRDANFHFNWKMTRPDAKKIIWAPHHSVMGYFVIYATFQWNYQFMYEFAKAHPEISWIVKPHPLLFFKAVKFNVFSTVEALKEYLQKWDDLPNAQVYTGAYYQDIFATSDGMIHDCGSFMAEYQYMDKPMIYLTRDTQRYNDLGEEILKVSYLVDGKDLNGIAENIQRVFIEGKDDKAAARRELFDKYLNYPKTNGMLASEFIYKSIADEFNPN